MDENGSTTDPEVLRKQRAFASLQRLSDRHASTPAQRVRAWHPDAIGPSEAVRLTALLGGGAQELVDGEDPVDVEDVIAALTLSAHADAELDATEAALIELARRLGLSWARIGFALGLGSAQAAQKRYARVSSEHGVGEIP
ncbi:hypothetical protein [Aestuariimicrobium ganziense]|uniref:hypothetical protein n=1 Tax=Aestuariimicrobium ganziense TaxID=2773677 RepID=UPI001941B45B|nr:hypothetical protein [Aestuariimicrobium ganziense]